MQSGEAAGMAVNYGELFYAARAACRMWETMVTVDERVVHGLAADLLVLIDNDDEILRHTRAVLLARRPLSRLDYSVYATIEAALIRLYSRSELVDSAAHDAALLATSPNQHYVVDLLSLFSQDVIQEAIELLRLRSLETPSPIAERARTLLADAFIAKSR